MVSITMKHSLVSKMTLALMMPWPLFSGINSLHLSLVTDKKKATNLSYINKHHGNFQKSDFEKVIKYNARNEGNN